MLFDPKITLPAGAVAPDAYKWEKGTVPPDDFVVSRHRDGSVSSFFGDTSWNWTSYHPQGRSTYFQFTSGWGSNELNEKKLALIGEMRWLMFVLIWIREGHQLSCNTLVKYFALIRRLAIFCEANNWLIRDVLREPVILKKYLNDSSEVGIKKLGPLLSTLMELGEERVGFVVHGGVVFRDVKRKAQEYNSSAKQHPPIPTRIYSEMIGNLIVELDNFDAISDKYAALLGACGADPLLGRHEHVQWRVSKRLSISRGYTRPAFPELLVENKLDDYFSSIGLEKSLLGAVSGLTSIQTVAKLVIQLYSGMRSGEVDSLPYDCLEIVDGSGKYFISGVTSKLNNGQAKSAKWVTSREGVNAVHVAQRVANIIYNIIVNSDCSLKIDVVQKFLFISPGYLPFSGANIKNTYGVQTSGKFCLARLPSLMKRILPIISECDIRELELIDPHRAWRYEPIFNVDHPWPLKAHQLRRSLALYATRSGLVSLPSLRRQLQHITEDMSRYYARGSTFAIDIMGGDKGHFGFEYQSMQPESEALSYIKNVLFSDEKLFGAHGTWIELQKRRNGAPTIEDREKTILEFRKGEMAFKETIVGGCTQIGPCDKKALRSIFSCIDCSRAVIKVSKLDRLIAAQRRMAAELEPNTMEWHTEMADLEALETAKAKFEKKC